MSTSSRLVLRASAAAGTVAVLMASGASMLLFASPAAADVTGYQTGYSYHQGLANGSGSALMANADASSASGAAANTGTTNSSSVAPTTNTPVTSQTTPTADTAPAAQTVTPTVQAAAPANAASAYTAAAPATPAATAFANVITPIAWAVIVVALLALIAAGIWAANREPADRTRVRRTTTYRRTA